MENSFPCYVIVSSLTHVAHHFRHSGDLVVCTVATRVIWPNYTDCMRPGVCARNAPLSAGQHLGRNVHNSLAEQSLQRFAFNLPGRALWRMAHRGLAAKSIQPRLRAVKLKRIG